MGLAPVKIRYVVDVTDVGPPHLYLKTVRKRHFRNLARAQKFVAKVCRKAMKKGGVYEQVCAWGSVVHQSSGYDPIRMATITTKIG